MPIFCATVEYTVYYWADSIKTAEDVALDVGSEVIDENRARFVGPILEVGGARGHDAEEPLYGHAPDRCVGMRLGEALAELAAPHVEGQETLPQVT